VEPIDALIKQAVSGEVTWRDRKIFLAGVLHGQRKQPNAETLAAMAEAAQLPGRELTPEQLFAELEGKP
jgi:hypothetical protein